MSHQRVFTLLILCFPRSISEYRYYYRHRRGPALRGFYCAARLSLPASKGERKNDCMHLFI